MPLDSKPYLKRFFLILGACVALACILALPYTVLWLHQSGDVAVERATKAQAAGVFAVFGSGVSQDFVDYKLQLYAAAKPQIAALGSSRVMQFRGAYFRLPFMNVGGTAGNLAVLRSTLEAMLASHKPKAVILGLDFWWFMPKWEPHPFNEVPPTSGSYNYGFDSLKKPWTWLMEGKISTKDFFAPVTGNFRPDRYGIMAQQTDDGFGPDGSWYYTAEITGQRRPFDYKFTDTLKQVTHGIKAFYWATKAPGPSTEHLDAFAEIYCKLRARGITVFPFIAPLSVSVYDAMKERKEHYPHLFLLREALAERGIDVVDLSDPRILGANDCEFVDGFHGGEVTYVRVLRDMADRWPALLAYVNMERIDAAIRDWKGHALVPDSRLTALPEVDFMEIACEKRTKK
ncbi:MAG: hypothetical protein LBR22_09330 [Desulfovibrio sp.]|jgi:hypothetical protein|nr:hypothetical protein [Desulfovibrio sp.]